MILNSIWGRYFLKSILKTTTFVLACFYGLYVLIDYAYHPFHAPWMELLKYYGFDLLQQLEILLPFALLIGLIRTLSNLSAHHELIALQSSGVSFHALMRPFLLVGLTCTLLLYLNNELFLPHAMQFLRKAHEKYITKKAKHNLPLSAKHLLLKDNSTLIFQSYQQSEGRFFDVYWIKNNDEIYRMKFLYPNIEKPLGEFVDYISRDSNDHFVVKESMDKQSFPDMLFFKESIFETGSEVEERPLTQLWTKLPSKEVSSDKEAEIVAIFHHKLALPLLCLLVILGPAPFCIRATRQLALFSINAISLFSLVALYLILNSGALLIERQVLSPYLAIWVPLLTAFALSILAMARRIV